MKKYILLTSGIRNVGGAQMYVANKVAYYESLGWDISVYFYTEGKVYINTLERFKDNFIPDLSNNIWSLPKCKRNKVIERITSTVTEHDEVVVESNLLSLAYWGELIAERVKGKHVVFVLEEAIPPLTSKQAEFLDFKLNRKELLNSHYNSLRNIFKNHYRQIYKDYNYQLHPYCSNVLDYKPSCVPSSITQADYNILSIGRLDKEYIKPMLDDIKSFLLRYQDKTFNLIFIGDDNSRIMGDYIKKMYSDVPNVNLSLLGYVFPVPYDWIEFVDVSIASSNSVRITSEIGIPTIAVDGRDLKAIGIHNHTTTSTVFRKENEPKLDINDLLDEVLINKQYPKSLKDRDVVNEVDRYLSEHIKLLEISSSERMYFNVVKIFVYPIRVLYLLKRLYINHRFIRKSNTGVRE